MRLKFYLLWFENENEWIDSKIDSIKEIIEEHGFEWVPPKICKNEEEFTGNYDEYDMVLMDYALTQGRTDGKTGANVIKSIRSKECLTTILFYSQYGEKKLREEIANRFLDGIFCADREGFLEKFEDLFVSSIKKIEDVNNLRGLVMAETADLEGTKEEIIDLYDSISCPKKKEITKEILSNVRNSNDSTKKFLDSKSEDSPFKEILHLLDLYKKSTIVHKINSRGESICDFLHEKFDEEIIQKRNLLAHVKEKIIENDSGKEIILESEKSGKKLIFSQEEAKKIRKAICNYKKELEKLRDSLKNDADQAKK